MWRIGVVEAQDDPLAGLVDPHLAPVGGGDLVVGLEGMDSARKTPFQRLLALRHLEDVDHLAFPFLVEDPRLDLLGHGLGRISSRSSCREWLPHGSA